MDKLLKLRLDLDETITYGDTEKAKTLAKDGLTLAHREENLGEMEYFRGQIEILNENYNKAIEHFDKAIKYNPKDGASYNDRALCMIEMGEKTNALKYFDKGIEVEPDFATIHHNRGWLLSRLNKYDEAIKCFNKALELDPDRSVTYENLADTYYKKGDTKSALLYYHKAINLLKPEYMHIKKELLKRIKKLNVAKQSRLKSAIILLFLIISSTCRGSSDYASDRRQMVDDQIKARGVKDEKVLSAMLKVPRHEFVPGMWKFLAYADRPLPIGEGQTISQPYIVALMTELLELKGNEKVLEIGTGSGYQAAILREIVSKVYTIEIIPELADSAEKRLKTLGYKDIYVKCGDGYYGWPEYAPFDGIIVTCGAGHIPPALTEQLAEGGRMVIPVGKGWQKLLLIRKKDGKTTTEFVTDVIFVPLLGGHDW